MAPVRVWLRQDARKAQDEGTGAAAFGRRRRNRCSGVRAETKEPVRWLRWRGGGAEGGAEVERRRGGGGGTEGRMRRLRDALVSLGIYAYNFFF